MIKLFEDFELDEFKKMTLESNLDTCKKNNIDVINNRFIQLYHGTSLSNLNKIRKSNKFKSGTWFTTNPKEAERYARMKSNKFIVTTSIIDLEDLYYNGYWSLLRDVEYKSGYYSSRSMKKLFDIN